MVRACGKQIGSLCGYRRVDKCGKSLKTITKGQILKDHLCQDVIRSCRYSQVITVSAALWPQIVISFLWQMHLSKQATNRATLREIIHLWLKQSSPGKYWLMTADKCSHVRARDASIRLFLSQYRYRCLDFVYLSIPNTDPIPLLN